MVESGTQFPSPLWGGVGVGVEQKNAHASPLARAFATTLPNPPPQGGTNHVFSHGHFTTGGIEERIESTLPPVLSPNTVPRS